MLRRAGAPSTRQSSLMQRSHRNPLSPPDWPLFPSRRRVEGIVQTVANVYGA